VRQLRTKTVLTHFLELCQVPRVVLVRVMARKVGTGNVCDALFQKSYMYPWVELLRLGGWCHFSANIHSYTSYLIYKITGVEIVAEISRRGKNIPFLLW
jgi:hypothetical protein